MNQLIRTLLCAQNQPCMFAFFLNYYCQIKLIINLEILHLHESANIIRHIILTIDDEVPTYGVLIDLLAKAEHSAMMKGNSVSLVLSTNFRQLYPHIQISRNDRFLDTVRRIAAPTLPSSLGPSKLNGSALRTYLTRTWTPKNRHRNGKFI